MIVSTIETNGDYKLHLDDNNAYLVEGPDGETFNLFNVRGIIIGPDYDPKYAGVQFEETGNGTYLLLWERLDGSGIATWAYEFNESGNYIGEYGISGDRREEVFEVDFDGDGIIGRGEGLINGDFSNGLSGWELLNPTGGRGPVDRFESAAFNSGNEEVYGDGIQQTAQTITGKTYELTLDLIESDGGVGAHTALIEIIDRDGTVLASTTETVGNNSVETVSLQFVANGSSTVRITNTTSTSSISTDLRVDNVSLDAVVFPETAPVANDDANGPILASALTDANGGVAKINGENVLSNDSDVNGDTLSIVDVNGTAVTSTGWLGWFDASNGGQIAINTDGRVVFRDNKGDFGNLPLGEQVETSITYTISDGNGGTSEATISFTVEGEAVPGPNVAPVANDDLNDTIFVAELTDANGAPLKINGENVLANDTDANGDRLDIVEIEGVAVTEDGWQGYFDASNGGQIAMNNDGRVVFRDANFDFADLGPEEVVDTSILYTVSDGNGGTDTAEVTFRVTNDFEVTLLDVDIIDVA